MYKNCITCIRASNIGWMNIGIHVISLIVQTHELYNMIKDNSGTSSRTTIKRRQCLSIRPCKTLLYKWKHVIIHNFTIAFLQLLNIFNARTNTHTYTHTHTHTYIFIFSSQWLHMNIQWQSVQHKAVFTRLREVVIIWSKELFGVISRWTRKSANSINVFHWRNAYLW